MIQCTDLRDIYARTSAKWYQFIRMSVADKVAIPVNVAN